MLHEIQVFRDLVACNYETKKKAPVVLFPDASSKKKSFITYIISQEPHMHSPI